MGFEDLAMPGFLSLRELNSLLLKYIGQVQDLELNQSQPGGSTSITVNIDRLHLTLENWAYSFFISRSEIISLQSKYDNQLADCKKQCDDKDKEIAALKAKIAEPKAEIKKLTER